MGMTEKNMEVYFCKQGDRINFVRQEFGKEENISKINNTIVQAFAYINKK